MCAVLFCNNKTLLLSTVVSEVGFVQASKSLPETYQANDDFDSFNFQHWRLCFIYFGHRSLSLPQTWLLF